MPLYAKFSRLFALDLNKDCTVADKLNNSVELSFRRTVRGGIEQHQMSDLVSMLESIVPLVATTGGCVACQMMVISRVVKAQKV
uniref:RNA-directed DNA polymerase, eukaryota, reverse transcriptase zinc-binding domain protein n=1 Tax=Tanacetum cinerariifolium TaxID=118510 RepID=A0A699JXL0_TANCI|nr:RNA-directed DNA polymerase, eukaryota, reverse transcriptase zinc-binding domain protein [Tanacetum cinerariifolium]